MLPKVTVFQKMPGFGNAFIAKSFPFFKYQLPVSTKQYILDYLSNEYPNFREKILFNMFCRCSR